MPRDTPSVQAFLIGPDWTTGEGAPFESINPATGQRNGLVGGASSADVDRAVQAAKAAQASAPWRHMLPHRRAAILRRIGDLIEAHAEELADLQMQQNGLHVPWLGIFGGVARAVYP